MTAYRTVIAVLHTTTQSTSTLEIDEADYLDWLGDDDDTPERVLDYIEASSDNFEDMTSVWNASEAAGRNEVWAAEFYEVRPYRGEPL